MSAALNPRDWMICGSGMGSWYAWNGRTRKRIDLYPIPQGGTWRDSLHPPRNSSGFPVNEFTVAVEQFERLIGPYYPTRPGARAYYPLRTRARP